MEAAKSPTPKKVEEVEVEKVDAQKPFNFFHAMKLVTRKGEVHKLEWEDKGYYVHLVNERLVLHKPDGRDYPWLISEVDMVGDDYIII